MLARLILYLVSDERMMENLKLLHTFRKKTSQDHFFNVTTCNVSGKLDPNNECIF